MLGFFKGKKEDDKLKLASELLKYFALSSGSPSKDALNIIEKVKDRNDILDEIIDLCKDIEKPTAYLNIANSYKLKGTKYRPQCIIYFNRFLENPIFKNATEIYSVQHFYNITTEKIRLGIVFENLGEAYEGEYDFENALKFYLNSYNINPYEPPIYCRLARIYSKMNNLDKSIDILESAKRGPYYKVYEWSPYEGQIFKDDTFIKVIDNHLNIYEEKKKKGYVYKPRKK